MEIIECLVNNVYFSLNFCWSNDLSYPVGDLLICELTIYLLDIIYDLLIAQLL